MSVRNGFLSVSLILVAITYFAGCEPSVIIQSPATLFGKEITAVHQGKCIKVVDGDTLDLLTAENQTIRFRFESIDCPEKGQPFGSTATEFVKQVAINQQITVYQTGVDTRYDRLIGFVFVDQRNLNAELLANGLAWHYKKYSEDLDLSIMENDARISQVGIWQDIRAIAPWDWRKMAKSERDLYR